MMIEVLVLIWLGRSFAKDAREKGQSVAGVVCMVIALWLLGEFIGSMIGYEFCKDWFIDTNQIRFGSYLFALIGAAAGATVAYVAVRMLPNKRAKRRVVGAASGPPAVSPLSVPPPPAARRPQR